MGYVRAAQARLAPHDSAERFAAMGVRVMASSARLCSPHEVEAEATGERLWARHIVIATGSEPRVPAVPDQNIRALCQCSMKIESANRAAAADGSVPLESNH